MDAVRWVLGEQSAKQLRGARMDEVIFAGNHRRRPLGMAEVTLTFENADATLPTPFAEVAVTRRVYRTGESEYFLNRTQVRLRDNMDMLLGTGLGPDASAIISQGQIDAILSAKPEQRREIFEEAAGTSKYQARKREAQRRLEQTETNALRINDVLAEIEQQVPAMETQVRRAKRYRKATQMLRDLEILSFVRKTAARREERTSLLHLLGAEETAASGAGAARERAADDANRARRDEYQATVAFDETNAARSEAAAQVQAAATSHATAQARSEEADRRCLDLARDVRSAALAVDDARTRIDVLGRELEVSRARRDEALAAAETAAADERAGSQTWESAYATLRSLEDSRAAVSAETAESETASHGARTERDRLTEHAARLANELCSIETRIQDARGCEAGFLTQLSTRTDAIRQRAEAVATTVADRDARDAGVEKARNAVEEARTKAIEIKARHDALQEIEDAGIGVPSGVKAVLGADGMRGVVGVVSSLLEVDGQYATAIDAALGGRAHNVVTERAEQAKAAIDHLKATKAGRATFLPLDLIRQPALPFSLEAAGVDGYVGRAVDLVRCDPSVRTVVEHLLRDVVVVKNLTAALKLAASHAPATIVTLEGELVRDAAITGGSGETEAGPLARRVMMGELKRDLAVAERAVAEAMKVHDAARDAAAQAHELVDRAARAHVDAQLQVHDAESAVEMVRAELTELSKRHDETEALAAQARTALEKAEADAVRYAQRAEAARNASARLERERLESARNADRMQAALSDLRDRHRAAAAEAAALVERVAQASDDVESARSAHVAAKHAHEEKIAALEEARTQRDRSKTEAAGLAGRKAESERQLADAETQVAAQRSNRDELSVRARELEEALAAQQDRERERSAELERHRIRLAQIDAELSVLQETFEQNPATDEECASVASRYASFEGEADGEIRRLRDETARLGNVNLNALEDQAALLERREFLRKQLADLEAARATILSVIAEIDGESLRQFNATFEQIAQAFSEMFARLFTGGVGKIWLDEAEDPTLAGIEIAVQPPGKKMQSLNLLSGGERAMTAVALIFAILHVRPSPFYIFDEIDAALDEANIGRFGTQLRDLAGRAQIIIITHNKATMTLADRIYGVTMGEPGISNILSLALEQVSA